MDGGLPEVHNNQHRVFHESPAIQSKQSAFYIKHNTNKMATPILGRKAKQGDNIGSKPTSLNNSKGIDSAGNSVIG